MRQRASSVIAFGAMLCLLFGNAAVVQVVAWGSMLIERSQRMDVAEAVRSTLSGASPCHLCLVASSLREQPDPVLPQDVSKQLKQAEASPFVPAVVVPPDVCCALVPALDPAVIAVGILHQPEPPPPRV